MAFAVGLCVLCCGAHGQSSYDLYGSARADALGNATTALPAVGGVHANPAAQAALPDRTVSFYARQSFGLAALRYGATHAAVPFDWGTVSSGVSTFGFEAYREIHASAGYARGLQLGTTRTLRVGGRLRYYHTAIEGYGHAQAVGLNAGLQVALLRSLRFGVHATNLHGATLGDSVPIPRTLAVGLHYRALDRLRVLVDVFKDVRFPATVRGGLEVRPVDPLLLRVGGTTAPARFAGGIGVRLGALTAQVAAERHQTLGWSPAASFRVRW
jgi:hypothetical protein